MREPPTDVSPAVLWRSLLALPRATAPIAYRLSECADVAFHVVALTSLEIGSIIDSVNSAPDELRSGLYIRELIAATLHTGEDIVFASADEVALMTEREVTDLGGQVLKALGRISPTFAASDSAAWVDALHAGAKSRTNAMTAGSLGSCVDVSYGYAASSTIARPDRFFGVPMRQLTDGHWMAYQAARRVVETLQSNG